VTVYSDGHACVYVRIGDGADMMCGGGSSNGGGGGGPVATPTAVPILRSWVSTAGFVGTFFDWCYPQDVNAVPRSPDCHPPDHHDVAGEHAVDIDPYPYGTLGSAVDVYYYDPWPGEYGSNIRHADLVWLPSSCADETGGQAAVISVYAIDSTAPGGTRYLANAVYRHMVQGTTALTVDNATLLGVLADNASTNGNCWTGPHLHQGVGSLGSGVTLEHDIVGFQFPNCGPYIDDTNTPYPGTGWSVGYPFCYQIRWNG
jgi:hypothetical protein